MRRALLFTVGLIVLAAAWIGPLPELARRSFSAHMMLHMSVVAIAAPLLALGAAGSRIDIARAAPALATPIPASIFELIVVWGWHAPGLHHLARSTSWGFILEQASFLFAGLWMWFSAFGGEAAARRKRRISSVAGLLLTAMHMTLLGALLALTPRTLYAHTIETFGLAPLQDQHMGGAIMLLIGGIAYLLGGLWLTVGMLREPSFDVKKHAT